MSKELARRTDTPMPMLNPQAIMVAFREPPPELPYDTGLISGWIDGMRRRRAANNAALDAEIAESQDRSFQAFMRSQMRLNTYQDELFTKLKKNDHDRKMWDLEEEDKKMTIQMKYYQMKNEEMQWMKRQKEFDREYGTGQD